MEATPLTNRVSLNERDLYGTELLLSRKHDEEEVAKYIEIQEKTHLAEGLELQQTSIRILPYIDGHIRGFGNASMVDINRDGYRTAKKDFLNGNQGADCLMRRRQHDITIAQQADDLMANGDIGDTIVAVSPYQEEYDDKTAKKLGFWPEFKRSYAWLYRKKNSRELECVDISIDQSAVTSYQKLLEQFGVYVPDGTPSHDYPGYFARIKGVIFDKQRDQLIGEIKHTYRQLNESESQNIYERDEQVGSMEFLDRNAKEYLALLVSMHKSIARSIETGTLEDLVRLSASRALKTLKCLSPDEVYELRSLLNAESIDENYSEALAKVIKAQRYGIWEAISDMVGSGQIKTSQQEAQFASPITNMLHTARLLDHIYSMTNQAAAQHKTMPSCAGGLSFLEQDENEVKSSIFDGEKYKFDRKMHCVVCDPNKKKNEVYCGPCGICKPCDTKLKSKKAA